MILGLAAYEAYDMRPELRAIADDVEQIGEPFELLSTEEDGTLFCVISCNELHIDVSFTADLSTPEACAEVEQALERLDLGPTVQRTYVSACDGTQILLPSVGDQAWLTWSARGAGDRSVVQVRISSGID